MQILPAMIDSSGQSKYIFSFPPDLTFECTNERTGRHVRRGACRRHSGCRAGSEPETTEALFDATVVAVP